MLCILLPIPLLRIFDIGDAAHLQRLQFSLKYCFRDIVTRSTQPSIPPGSINEYQRQLKAGMAHSDCGWTCGCAGKTEIPWEHAPYLRASAVVIHYEEALYQVYAPLPLNAPYCDPAQAVWGDCKSNALPAISAPVKRVFICCSIYATTQITNDQQDTSDLVFLKCNLN